MQLQEELTTTENQISFSRQHYNATVLDYNNSIQTIPTVLHRRAVRASPSASSSTPSPRPQEVPTVDLSLR